MMNIIKGSIWIVAFILGINLSFEMISQANTMENIVGFFLLALIFLVSYKTRGKNTLVVFYHDYSC